MPKLKELKVPVTKAALLARINRHLKREDHVLRAGRGAAVRQNCGEYYVIDWRRNFVVQHHVDPARLGRRLEVLHPHEIAVGFEE